MWGCKHEVRLLDGFLVGDRGATIVADGAGAVGAAARHAGAVEFGSAHLLLYVVPVPYVRFAHSYGACCSFCWE